MSKKYLIRILIAAAFLAVAIIIFFLFSPEKVNFFPRCPFLVLTGLDCPGCGTQRAMHHLTHLRIWEAMKFNVLMVISIPYVIFGIYMEYFGGKERFPALRQKLFGLVATRITFVVVMVYWIGRNVLKFI